MRFLPFSLRLLTAVLIFPFVTNSQTDPVPSPSPGTAPSPSPAPAATPALVERTIYAPYDKLEKIFEKEDRGVFLPYREFIDLWNKLNLPADLKNNQPPIDGVLASAHYKGRVEGDAAIFDAELQFEALKDGWSKVSLGGPDLNIAEVKPPAAKPTTGLVPVLHLASTGYEAILPARGSYPVNLSVLGKITRDAGSSTLKLLLPRTAASRFELAIPDIGLDFSLTPASAFTVQEENGATRLSAFFGSTQAATITWRKRAAETTLPPLIFAETSLEATVTPGALRTVAAIDLRLLRAPVGTFEISVPSGQQVLGVEGGDLRDWNIAPATAADGRQHITVNLATPAREKYKLRVTLESPVAKLPAKLSVPVLEIAHAEGQSGTITVAADSALAVSIDPREGVTQQGISANSPSPRENKDDKSAGVFLGSYRFLHLPYGVDLEARAAEPVVEGDVRTLYTVAPDLLEMTASVHYDVKKAGIFSALLDVPKTLGHVEATGDIVGSFALVAATPGAPAIPAGYQRLEVRFKEQMMGKLVFNLKADTARPKPDEAVTLAVPQPVGISREEGHVAVAINQSLDPKTTEAGDLHPEGIENLDTPLPGDAAANPVSLGFSYRGATPKPAQLAFTLRKPRINAEVASRVALRESIVAYLWTIAYNIEYAGIDDLVIQAPASMAEDLQFTGDDIKEKVLDDEKDAAGKPTGGKCWHVRLRQKKLGHYELKISAERALPAVAAGKPAGADWPELKTEGPFHETGTIAVVKDNNLEITRAIPTGLELIDPAELPSFGPDANETNTASKGDHGEVFLAYRYAAHPAALKLEFSKNEFLPVPTAIVNYAVIQTTMTADRSETTEAVYWVRNNGRQFLSVVLPPRGQMLSDVFVNGQPQQPSKRPDKNALLVRLPARSLNAADAASADSAISVRLVYSVPGGGLGRGGLGIFGHLHLSPPVLEETKVLQTQYTLYLPNGYRYVHLGGAMREAASERRWNEWRAWLDAFVPSLGQDTAPAESVEWQNTPSAPAMTGGGFDSTVPKEGTLIILHSLDAPSPVDVSYRSLGYANTVEALAFFAALGGGLALFGSGRRVRLAYFFIAGIGALIIAGAVAPRAAGFWTAIYLGVFLAALAWLAAKVWRGLARLLDRIMTWRVRLWTWMKAKSQRPPTPPPPAAPPPLPTNPPTPDAA